jgi:hypothetical protein
LYQSFIACKGVLLLREGHFYGIAVGARFLKEEEPCADVLKDLQSHGAFVGWQIIEDYDVPFTQCRTRRPST